MKRAVCLLLLVTGLTTCMVGTARANFCDHYYTLANPNWANADPLWENGSWKWRSAQDADPGPWIGPLTESELQNRGVPFTLEKGFVMLFGHENLYQGPNWVKTVTFRCDYTGTGHPKLLEAQSGCTPLQPYVLPKVSKVSESPPPGNGHYELVLTIVPQGDWEWIAIQNDPGDSMEISNVYFHTDCVPEPSSILALGGGLVSLAGMAVRRRR